MQATSIHETRRTADGDLTPLETSVSLLARTQAYLRALLSRRATDTLLTEAWDEFYRVYSALIRRFVLARGVRGADVDDCLQDVWAEVARRLADFRRPPRRPGLRAWLYTLVRSKATDLTRRRIRHSAVSFAADTSGGEPVCAEPDPAEACEQQWEHAMLQTALAEVRACVSPLSFRVLHMRLIEDRSVGEVAAALDLTPQRVRYRHHRMLRKLRARLAVYTGRQFGDDGGV